MSYDLYFWFFRIMRRRVAKKGHGFIIGGKTPPPIWRIKPCQPVCCIICLVSRRCNTTRPNIWGHNPSARGASPQRRELSGLSQPPCGSVWPDSADLQNGPDRISQKG
jgi:hypothetical protein